MRAKDLHSVLIPFGTILGASAIAVLGNDNGFAGESGMNLIEIACGVHCRTWHPGSEILIGLDKVHKPGDVALRSAVQGIRSIGTWTARVQLLGLLQHALRKLVGRRGLTSDLVAEAPNYNAGMVAVPCNHLAQLFQSVLQDVGIRLRPHALERV